MNIENRINMPTKKLMKPRIRIFFVRSHTEHGMVQVVYFHVPPGREAFRRGPVVPLRYAIDHWQPASLDFR